jgi:hypothetical protein
MQPPWDDTFALAWAAYIGGTTPVGAMLVAGDGERMAIGLNRRYTSEPVVGQLSGSRLAHAELNALAGVDPRTNVRDHTLNTTPLNERIWARASNGTSGLVACTFALVFSAQTFHGAQEPAFAPLEGVSCDPIDPS